MSDFKNSLWVEKYRPNSLENYIGNSELKNTVQTYIKNGDIPHMLFYGKQGQGKTTLAKIIANELDADVLYINASDENSVDIIRNKIKTFVSSIGFKKWKIVILDEADFATGNFQAALRNLMETFSTTSRFILTCNYVEKIIPPIRSRCNEYAIYPPSKKEVAKQLANILKEESIDFDIKNLAIVINNDYPDIRAIINNLQQQCLTGKLVLSKLSVVEHNYLTGILNELTSPNNSEQIYKNIRQLIANSQIRTFDELFRYLYDNIDEFVPAGKKASVIVEIAKGMQHDSMVVDREINVMAMIIEILSILKS